MGANDSLEVKQSDDGGKAQVSDGKGNVVKIEKSKDGDDEDGVRSEVSDGKGNVVKTTTKTGGGQTSVIKDGKGNVVKAETGDKSNGATVTDGKGNKITVNPNGGVVLHDPKGSKIVIPKP